MVFYGRECRALFDFPTAVHNVLNSAECECRVHWENVCWLYFVGKARWVCKWNNANQNVICELYGIHEQAVGICPPFSVHRYNLQWWWCWCWLAHANVLFVVLFAEFGQLSAIPYQSQHARLHGDWATTTNEFGKTSWTVQLLSARQIYSSIFVQK